MDETVFLAHIAEDGREQTVDEHERGTAELCAKFAAQFGAEEHAKLEAMRHDDGKNTQGFQRRLRGGPAVDHSTAGAFECFRANAVHEAICIAGHHGGLPDVGNAKMDTSEGGTFFRSTGMGGISADDPQAVQKLEKKLESLEKSQETMKAVNAYYRKHKTLDGCPHLPPEELEKLKADMASSWHLEDKPFATWALSNNSAEIRRVKDRIKSLSQQKEIGFVGWEFDGGKVEANTEANRLQIFFEDKPDEATREALKSNGFRWSPKAGAWQRQLTSNAYYAADYVKAIAPLTGEKPTELQRAHIRQQKVAAQEQPAQEQPEQEAPQDKDTFSIYQIKGGDETRDLRFEPYDRLTAAGHRVDAKNYALVYSAELTPGTSLEDIYTRFNIDHPKDFKGHSLSVSDVVVLHQNGQDTAHYVDSLGYKDVPEFLQPENYLKTAEQTTEQNYNMIDGQINNTPTAAELEEKAKAGEQISLAEYAEALKTDKGRGKPAKQEKPSIRAQLKAAKEQTPKKQARQKTQDLERS